MKNKLLAYWNNPKKFLCLIGIHDWSVPEHPMEKGNEVDFKYCTRCDRVVEEEYF